MALGLIELANWRGTRKAASHSAAYVRPAVENLEERAVMSSPASMAAAALAPGQHTASFLPINITGITTQVVNCVTQLVAQGTIAGQAFTAPITLSTTPNPSASPTACPILHLTLGPIDLNVLGLQVKTSPICLAIDATPGQGQLLGNLLCDLSHALDGSTLTDPLGGFLGGLTSINLTTLTSGLTNVLNGALGALTSPANATVLPSSTTNLLHLSVGPLNLNLLGLNVHLDNCSDGPVTVDLNAVSGSGNLLGNLLRGIAHLADHNPLIPAIDHKLAHLGRDLLRLAR
jgi:hypothetical protein